jgi:hypothetical protein
VLTSALCIPLSRSLAYRVPIDNSWSVEQLRAASAVSCLAAAQDGVVLRAALAALRTAPPADRADEPETAALQLSVLQVACVLYAQIDAVETQQANAAGWPEPESTPQATDAAAAALHAAAPQLAAAACPLVSSALGGLTGLAWFRPLYAALAEYVLRFLRHLASLEPLPGGSTAPLLEASAVTAAVTAVLQKEESSALLRHLALSALWAWLDAQPNGAGTLAACPDAVACMLSLLAPLKAPAEYAPWANEAECEEHNNNTRRQVAGELQSSAVGSLWGCCSRVSPDAVAAFADAGVADAAAALLTADADASTPSARFCAAGLLAGWMAACAPAPPARLVAAWAAPGVAAATAAMLARDAAALARGGVEADVMFDVLQFDWKTRDLSEAVSALCRLLSASAWSDPDCAWLELAAAVAAWPLCVLLCAGCRVLTPRRSAHLAADARLAPALAALAASASAPVVAVARLALSRLAAASPDSAAAVVAALAGPARDLATALPADVTLLCMPQRVALPACRTLLAARSQFFKALLAGDTPFAEAGAAQVTIHDVDAGAMRSFLRWAVTGGAAAASLCDALACLRLAQRLLAPELAAAMADAAIATAPTASCAELAVALRFGFGTDGPHAAAIAAAAVDAALAGGHAPQLLAAEPSSELAVPPEAHEALRPPPAVEAAAKRESGSQPSDEKGDAKPARKRTRTKR